ncbi:GNAT family N-acetyltransferase [Streptomyces graminofaciens]|uniref:GNAT family N-acetyltransferase n=1 Tax=Streptomyces graminofaciens TaxID=68212 RepID=UPI002574582B|nr:GNAT family N-acetyltransferase [Streptomyces graminofaciens]
MRSPYRGRGFGGRAVVWLTAYLFEELPGIRRIEATTRQDNAAMRLPFSGTGMSRRPTTATRDPGRTGGREDGP